MLFASSCTPTLPLLRGAELQTPAIAAFIAQVKKDEATRTSLSAEGSLTLKRNVAKLKARMSVAVQLDGEGATRVRLDVSTDAGNVLFALATNGTRVTILDLEHKQFIAGPAGPGDLTPIGLSAIDTRALGRLLLARTPCAEAPSGADQTHLEWQGCLGGTLLATYAPNPNGHVYLRALALDARPTKFSATLIGHTTLGIARRVELVTKDVDFAVALDEIDPGDALDPELFELSPPPGVVVMDRSEVAAPPQN
ncbi:MAG: hypothetical protein IT381_02355 [Deltaproteobacteria bacterium]|nr:hypothetical protein [Deltaproteobacteria bacterium]